MNSKLVDFKMCTSKQLYWLVIEKMCQLPKSIEKWIDIFQTDESVICSMWKGVNMYWKPSIMIELDFNIVQNSHLHL
jgi:hypothetical protein